LDYSSEAKAKDKQANRKREKILHQQFLIKGTLNPTGTKYKKKTDKSPL
jgi:hypothetical protein